MLLILGLLHNGRKQQVTLPARSLRALEGGVPGGVGWGVVVGVRWRGACRELRTLAEGTEDSSSDNCFFTAASSFPANTSRSRLSCNEQNEYSE
jgi:hypothetical protein